MVAACPAEFTNHETLIWLYHGSPYLFDDFRPSPAGIHFGTLHQAEFMATKRVEEMTQDEYEEVCDEDGFAGHIYHCQIAVMRTKRIDDPQSSLRWAKDIDIAIREGYDSIVYRNDFEWDDGADSLCIFCPSAIRIIE